MELTNGRLRVQAGYSLKVGLPNYSSHDRSAGISFEFDLPENAEEDAVIDAALLLEAKLDTNLKLVVATALGVSVDEVDGTLIPILPEAPAPKAPAKTRSNGGGRWKGPSKPASNGGGRTFDNSDRTHLVSVSFGGETHDITVIDQRDLKKSGKFSEKSPDFKLVDFEINGSDGVWMRTKAGGVNKIFAQIVEQIDVDEDAMAAAEDATWD